MLDGAEHYWPCKNLSDEDDVFILDPMGYAAAEDTGKVLAVVHSHPGAPASPSEPDQKACSQYGLPWFIYGMEIKAGQRLTLESSVESKGMASDSNASQNQAVWAPGGVLRSESF